MLSPSKKFNKIQLPVSQFAGSELYTQAVGGGGGNTPDFKWQGRSNEAKIKSQKKNP